jgi:hypothetical protein
MDENVQWDGVEQRELEATLTPQPEEKVPVKMLDSPFWKVMSVIGMALFGGAITTLFSALAKLDKLNDAQIETKTMMTVLISQRTSDQEDMRIVKSDIKELQISQVQLKTLVEKTHNIPTNLTGTFDSVRH